MTCKNSCTLGTVYSHQAKGFTQGCAMSIWNIGIFIQGCFIGIISVIIACMQCSPIINYKINGSCMNG